MRKIARSLLIVFGIWYLVFGINTKTVLAVEKITPTIASQAATMAPTEIPFLFFLFF